MARRYGVWAGNRIGHPENPERCVVRVHDDYDPGGHQCCRQRGHGPQGLFCKQHARMGANGERLFVPKDKETP